MKIKSRLFLSILMGPLSIGISGCGDLWANRMAKPPALHAVPMMKLEDLAREAYQAINEDGTIADYMLDEWDPSSVSGIGEWEKTWARGLKRTLHHLAGWNPDLCALLDARDKLEARKGPLFSEGMERDGELELWRSYNRTAHPRLKSGNPTHPRAESTEAEKRELAKEIGRCQWRKALVSIQNDSQCDPDKKDKECVPEKEFATWFSPLRLLGIKDLTASIAVPYQSFKLPQKHHDRLTQALASSLNTPAANIRLEFLNAKGSYDYCRRREAAGHRAILDECDIANVVQERLWQRIDYDHSLFLTKPGGEKDDFGKRKAWEANRIPQQSEAPWENFFSKVWRCLTFRWWYDAPASEDRDLTVSKKRPAALTVAVRRPNPLEEQSKKLLLLDLKDRGQAALIKLLPSLACGEGQPDCSSKKREIKDLLHILEPDRETPGPVKDFLPSQNIELAVSSAVNSPDQVNRFDYIATYLYVLPHPLPVNPPVSLAEEYWGYFLARHSSRPLHERDLNLPADLDAAWYAMRVRIESVETTVSSPALPKIEIAKVTRESKDNSSLVGGVTFSGATAGINATGTLSSEVQTKVEENIVKQLDQRSIWINSPRDVLRITQRGNDAINVAGTIREMINLHIPVSQKPVYLLSIDNGQLKLSQRLGQPIYSKVHGLAVTVAIVREPFRFKRAATEKFGLPDSADAFLVLQVSRPIYLDLWAWDREVDILTLNQLQTEPEGLSSDSPRQSAVTGPGTHMMFYSPALNLEDDVRIAPQDAGPFRRALKSALYGLKSNALPAYFKSSKPREAKLPIEEAAGRALEKVPGTVVHAELTKIRGKAVWDIRIRGGDKSISKVLVDMNSGAADIDDSLTVCLERKSTGFYIHVNDPSSPLDQIWLGKKAKDRLTPFDWNDIPYLADWLNDQAVSCSSRRIN